MRAHYLQHVPFEGPGMIESWLRSKGYEITNTRFFESNTLPDPGDVDFLIVMGGPMSVNDESDFPWLVEEKQFVRRCVDSGKPVLGVCLGAQLIASSMGARVYPNREKEIGWFPIEGIRPSDHEAFRFPSSLDVFHWHGETFDLPSGARHLARSIACENQAFQIGTSVIGIQFHLETTPESVREMVSHGRAELIPATYVQSEETILSARSEPYRACNRVMEKVLHYLNRAQFQV